MSDSHACTDWRPEDWWLFRRLNAGTREQRVDLQQGQSVDARAAQRAAEHVNDVITQGGAEAVSLITELLQSAADTDALVLVGSGPLEDLLHEHGAAVVEEVERLAAKSPRSRRRFGRCGWSTAPSRRTWRPAWPVGFK